ncbi:MAG TPA: DoxX family protein [Chitinophagaceae bacterium]|jgi:uncharacterized membrane protein YphA (DoxX/SURF4 family)|nr:DoxX family protein [Chitinophagaceae bacterium]
MKASVTIARIIVGILFIFSGLVKANDPLGLSYKMQEFFEVWGVHGLNSNTLLLSVLMNAFEIIAGFALLLGWRIKLFSWLLLALIVFFTFLTGYTYITGKPTNCGCFGDCLPITSKTSFLKDVVLTILIAFLLWQKKHIKPLFSEKANTIAMLGITLFSFIFQWYTLAYLPVVDCLSFKKGSNIPKKMQMPGNAIPDSTVITFEYIKDGTVFKYPVDSIPQNLDKKEYLFVKKDSVAIDSVNYKQVEVYVKGGTKVKFTAASFPADFSAARYTMLRRFDDIIRKGSNNEPPIKGFSLSGNSGIDSTGYVLARPYAVLLFIEKFSTAGTGWKKKFADIVATAKTKNIDCFIITAEPGEAAKFVKGTSFAAVPVFKCDYKVIETAARSNPCIYLIEQGTVLAKYSGKQLGKIEARVNALPKQSVSSPVVPVTPTDSITNQP